MAHVLWLRGRPLFSKLLWHFIGYLHFTLYDQISGLVDISQGADAVTLQILQRLN